MADPGGLRDELTEALDAATRSAHRYLGGLDRSPVVGADAVAALDRLAGPLPGTGDGAVAALRELAEVGDAAATRSGGPRFFHFVAGGATPAALGADWLTSTYDQVAFSWVSSAMGARLDQVATAWLRELFELPDAYHGFLVSGATMANFTGLAAARNWWAEQLGVDVEHHGLAGLPAPSIFTSGYVHPSAVQAVGMLGFGRGNVRRLVQDATGRLDLDGLAAALHAADGPAILIANAGEANTGAFDPIAEMAELAQRHRAWLHVEGAFGLFARLSPATRRLTDGIDRADSLACDAHKWLNVPYDCGFGFVRDPSRLASAFTLGTGAASARGGFPDPAELVPENSRRARSLAVWATLRAYGRDGYRAMVERHLGLARHLATRLAATGDFELLAQVPLNIVCFRARPADVPEDGLDALNVALGEDLLRDGRVYAGTTVYRGVVAFRPAIVNWRSTEADVDLLVEVLRELLAQRLSA